LSYLHGAIKPLNQLRALEDATIIYHLSRAPERRVFYVDVGNLPKMKAEQHVQNMMVRYKNRVSYNAATGETADERQFMHMNEDFWMARREGGKGTEIDVLSGGTQLPDLLQSVEYFQDRLYRAVQVPLTRMKPDAVYNLGRATEITRDEVNFSKLIDRIRGKFVEMIFSALEQQLILKKITIPADWQDLRDNIKIKWARDNYFSELKDLEIMNDRLIRLRDADEFAGKYFPHEWIRTDIMRQSDEDRKLMDKQMDKEIGIEKYNQPILDPNDPNGIENVEPGPPMPPRPKPAPLPTTSATTYAPKTPSYKKSA